MRARTRKRLRLGLVVLLVAMGLAGLGFYRADTARADAADAAARSQGTADIANLSSASAQQRLAAQLTTAIGQLTANPAQADHAAGVTAACGLVGQITLPLPVDQDRWVAANCASANQGAHPEAYSGGDSADQ
jgi:hypothetical protein